MKKNLLIITIFSAFLLFSVKTFSAELKILNHTLAGYYEGYPCYNVDSDEVLQVCFDLSNDGYGQVYLNRVYGYNIDGSSFSVIERMVDWSQDVLKFSTSQFAEGAHRIYISARFSVYPQGSSDGYKIDLNCYV